LIQIFGKLAKKLENVHRELLSKSLKIPIESTFPNDVNDLAAMFANKMWSATETFVNKAYEVETDIATKVMAAEEKVWNSLLDAVNIGKSSLGFGIDTSAPNISSETWNEITKEEELERFRRKDQKKLIQC